MNFIWDKETYKKLAREYFWLISKPFLIVAIIFFVFSLFFLLVGYLDDKEALYFGYPLLFLGILLLIRLVVVHAKISKQNKAIFERNHKDGIVEYSFECKDENTFEFRNMNSGSVVNIRKADIVKCKVTKTFMFLELYTQENVVLQKNED